MPALENGWNHFQNIHTQHACQYAHWNDNNLIPNRTLVGYCDCNFVSSEGNFSRIRHHFVNISHSVGYIELCWTQSKPVRNGLSRRKTDNDLTLFSSVTWAVFESYSTKVLFNFRFISSSLNNRSSNVSVCLFVRNIFYAWANYLDCPNEMRSEMEALFDLCNICSAKQNTQQQQRQW